MQLPDDVLTLIKSLSRPIPNNGYTMGLTDEEIALLFIDVWMWNNFKDDANFMLLLVQVKRDGLLLFMMKRKYIINILGLSRI